MKKRILLGIVMIEICGILGCFYPFYKTYEIKDDYVHIIRYEDQSDSVDHYYYYYFAESEKPLQNPIDRNNLMKPNRYTIFIGDSVEVLLSLPFKPKIRTVKIDGTAYTRYRYSDDFHGRVDVNGRLDVYMRNNTIKFMRIKLFAEGMGPQR